MGVVVDAIFCSAPMALVAWWYARAMEGFVLEGAWLDDRMARADGAIYLRVGGPLGFTESSAGEGR